MYPSFIIANPSKIMAVKVLIDSVNNHYVADVQQVENKETGETVAYWLSNPQVVSYERNEEGQLNVGFHNPCPVSGETEYAVRADHIVSILEPLPNVAERYNALIHPSDELAETPTATDEPVEETAE